MDEFQRSTLAAIEQHRAKTEKPREELAPASVEVEPDESQLGDPFRFDPVPLSTFVQDKGYLNNPKLSLVQFAAVRHAEQIYFPRTIDMMYDAYKKTPLGSEYKPVRYVNFITLQWGKGSGKDHVCRIMLARWMYLLLCLDSPQKYFDMPPQDSIHFLNVASSAPQASRVFFAPFRELIKSSPFFKAHGTEPFEYEIKCENHISAISGHSDAETQEGLNIMGGIADEISAFKTADEIQNSARNQGGREPTKTAEGIVKMMRTSARTRFGLNMKIVRISYPRFKGDAIQQATTRGRKDIEEKGEKSQHFVDGPRATWDVNPRVKGRSTFEEDYLEDPGMAKAMYECEPGLATNRFFRNTQAIAAAFQDVRVPDPVSCTYHWGPVEVDGQYELAWHPQYTFAPNFEPIEGAMYTLHADMAQNGDRAGVAMSHVKRWQEIPRERWDGEEISERMPVVHLDFVLAYESDVGAEPQAREIQVRWFRQLVMLLREKGFYIAFVSMDGWQSLDSLQILAARGIPSDRVSMDRNDSPWLSMRDLLNDGRYEGYDNDLLIEELEAVRRLPNGKVDHPSGGCFVGETRIPLLDGTMPQISELHGKSVWVYSARPDGTIVPGWARGRRTKFTKHLVDVVLDNGYVARCTPEHMWMMRDGSYRAAKDLRPGVDRLMPITRNWPANGGYERVTDRAGTRTLTHHLVEQWKSGQELQQGDVVHHDNHVKTDNRPENLQVETKNEHSRRHTSQRHAGDPEYRRKLSEGTARFNQLPETRAKRSATSHLRSLTREERVAEMKRRGFYRDDITMEKLGEVAGKAKTANEAAKMLECGRNVVVARLRDAGYESWNDFVAVSNHKVRAVIEVELVEPVPVYDLEVDEWSNFALTGGVFVHNSKDLADAVTGAALGSLTVGGNENVDDTGAALVRNRNRQVLADQNTALNPLQLPKTNLGLSDAEGWGPLAI